MIRCCRGGIFVSSGEATRNVTLLILQSEVSGYAVKLSQVQSVSHAALGPVQFVTSKMG